MRKVLLKKFFNRSAPEVAENLIGKYLVRKVRGKESAFMITEVEAYEGHEDKASHASKGKTKRTEVMFSSPGVFYIYLVYGMYEMLNIVTGANGYPAAVLIRGVKGINGPGRLTKNLNITRALNAKKVASESGLWIEDRGDKIPKKYITKTPRIGVGYAGPVWSQKQYRFVLE